MVSRGMPASLFVVARQRQKGTRAHTEFSTTVPTYLDILDGVLKLLLARSVARETVCDDRRDALAVNWEMEDLEACVAMLLVSAIRRSLDASIDVRRLIRGDVCPMISTVDQQSAHLLVDL